MGWLRPPGKPPHAEQRLTPAPSMRDVHACPPTTNPKPPQRASRFPSRVTRRAQSAANTSSTSATASALARVRSARFPGAERVCSRSASMSREGRSSRRATRDRMSCGLTGRQNKLNPATFRQRGSRCRDAGREGLRCWRSAIEPSCPSRARQRASTARGACTSSPRSRSARRTSRPKARSRARRVQRS